MRGVSALRWRALLRLGLELMRWRLSRRKPVLWWRDDDARGVTAELERLLRVAGEAPLTLAVIPSAVMPGLAARLRRAANVAVAQHGVDHQNRRPAGQPECEHEAQAAPALVAARIRAAREAMRRSGLAPVFYAPPWDHLDAVLIAALPMACGKAVSSASAASPRAGLVHVGTHLDILCRLGAPRFRGEAPVLEALRQHLKRRRLEGRPDAHVGLLTHHLDHDEAAWSFLGWLVAYARGRFEWRSASELVTALT